jgi:8-oxo-dGTP pyrophosphatase MutT (NUDIX family)
MAQNYIVFTEKKKLFVGSYEHQDCEIVTLDPLSSSKKWWKSIHDQANSQLYFNINFEDFKSRFKLIRAAGGIVVHENELLMIYRNKCWDLPKGWIEGDEFPMQAALREVTEECGQLALTIDSLLPIITYHLYVLKGEVVLKETAWFYMSVDPGFKLTPQRKEGITKVDFVDLTEAKLRVKESYPMIQWIVEQIQKN